jgi:hypothetical protein
MIKDQVFSFQSPRKTARQGCVMRVLMSLDRRRNGYRPMRGWRLVQRLVATGAIGIGRPAGVR